jgi:GDP-D-mannose 3',5'-epimerase
MTQNGSPGRKRVLVAGAGGFIGNHLVRFLKAEGYWVRGVDLTAPRYEETQADDFELLDLCKRSKCLRATRGIDHVYQLAADMGGMGYISSHRAEIAHHNVLINAHMLEAARQNGVSRYFFASSACVYPQYRQDSTEIEGLREEDVHPADPEEGYGWEKLYSEKLCQYYREEGRLLTRVARFHNVYGPVGTYEGGREKAPAAICRKVALACDGDEIEVWGDGRQSRSFLYVDDCVDGIHRIATSEHPWPLNLGSEERVSIDELVDLVAAIAGKTIRKRHNLDAPQGVRGRNSENSRLGAALGWLPSTSLRDGLMPTYAWIERQLQTDPGVRPAGKVPAAAGLGAGAA